MCIKSRTAALLLACVMLASSANGQVAKKNPEAEDVLKRSLEALGVAKGNLASLTVLGTYTRWNGDKGESCPVRIRALSPEHVLWEFDTPEGPLVMEIDGEAGTREFKGEKNPLLLTELAGRTLEPLPAMALAHWLKSADANLDYKGRKASGNSQHHHIAIDRILRGNKPQGLKDAYAKATRVEVFIDESTNLPARLRYYDHPRDWRIDIPIDLVFSDFRRVGGVLVSCNITRFHGDQRQESIQIQSIK